MQSDKHKGLIEAALFMSSEPMSIGRLSKIIGVSSLGYIKGTLLELRDEYESRGIHLVETPDGWSFQVDRLHLHKVADLTPYADIPEGQKRTLALIAYKEPVTQSEVIKIQGNKTYAYIKSLASRGLIRTEKQGRTKVLSLTQEFERYFGAEKEKIKERLAANMSRRQMQRDDNAADSVNDAHSGKLNMNRQ
jgi:segregation and condensation protein B